MDSLGFFGILWDLEGAALITTLLAIRILRNSLGFFWILSESLRSLGILWDSLGSGRSGTNYKLIGYWDSSGFFGILWDLEGAALITT